MGKRRPKMVLHIASGQLVEYTRVRDEWIWVRHPRTKKLVKSKRVLYDQSIRSEFDLAVKRSSELAARREARAYAHHPIRPCRVRDPLGNGGWAFLLSRMQWAAYQAGKLIMLWTPYGFVLADHEQQADIADGRMSAAPGSLHKEYGLDVELRVQRIRQIAQLPGQRLNPTAIGVINKEGVYITKLDGKTALYTHTRPGRAPGRISTQELHDAGVKLKVRWDKI